MRGQEPPAISFNRKDLPWRTRANTVRLASVSGGLAKRLMPIGVWCPSLTPKEPTWHPQPHGTPRQHGCQPRGVEVVLFLKLVRQLRQARTEGLHCSCALWANCTPNWAKTAITRPEQSMPFRVVPPHR